MKKVKIIAIIGIILFLLSAGLIFALGMIINNNEFQGMMSEELNQEQTSDELTEEKLSAFFESATETQYNFNAGWLTLITLVGIAAVYLRQKNRILSGILFVVCAGVAGYLFWWMLLPLVPALLYLIAGLILFLNKPAEKS